MAIYSVEVNGVEQDALLSSLNIKLVANGMDTFSIDFDDPGDASPVFRPELEDEVVILEDGVPLVGGLITTAPEECLGGPALADIVTRVSCASFSIFASFRFVSATIPAGTLKSVLQVLDNYLTGYGVTLDGAQVDGPTIPEVTFTRVRLDEALNELTKRTNYVWEIDASKVFRMYAPGSVAAPYDLLDTGAVRQVGDVTVEPTRDDMYANRLILVISGNGPATSSETFTAADGVTSGGFIYFTAKYPASSSLNDLYPNVLTFDGAVVGVIGFGPTQLPGDNWYWDFASSPARLVYTIGSPWAFPAGAEEIEIAYAIGYPFEVIVEDVPAQAPPVGIRERVLQIAEAMTLEAATDLANAILARVKTTLKVARWNSDDTGWRPGQSLTITQAKRATNADFLITNVDMAMAPGDKVLRHSCSAVEGEVVQGDWRQPYKDWLGDKLGSGGSGGVSSFGVSSPAGGTLFSATRTFTDAQFKAAADVPQLINTVAVPANKRIKVVGASLRVKTTGGAYTNVDLDAAGVHLICASKRMSCGYENDSTVPVAKFSELVAVVHDKLSDLPIPAMDAINGLLGSPQGSPATDEYVSGEDPISLPTSTALLGAGLYLLIHNNGSGAFTGGGCGNGVRINVLYVLEEIGIAAAPGSIPAGSLAFSGWGDSPMEFTSPSGVALPFPGTSPECGSGCDGIVTLANGTVAVIGGNTPNFGTTGVGTFSADFSTTVDSAAGANGFPGQCSARDSSGNFYGIKSSTGRIYRYNSAGLQTQDWAAGAAQADSVGVNAAGTIAYYVKNASRTIVRAWDLTGNTDLGTFQTAPAGYECNAEKGLLGLSNGDVLIAWSLIADNDTAYIRHYSAAGALLYTYTLPGTVHDPTQFAHGLTDTSFWVSYYDAVSTFSEITVAEIELVTGTILHSFTPEDGTFEFDGPFCIVSTDIC